MKQQSIAVYESRRSIYLVALIASNKHYEILEFNRPLHFHDDDKLEYNIHTKIYSSDQVDSLMSTNKASQTHKNIACIYGFIRLLGSYYMVIVTRTEKVASIHGNIIHLIKDTEMIPIVYKQRITVEETRYKNILTSYRLADNDFYFSYSYNITQSLQNNVLDLSATETIPPKHGVVTGTISGNRSSDNERSFNSPIQERFMWNHYALQPFLEDSADGNKLDRSLFHNNSPLSRFIVPVIHGYLTQSTVQLVTGQTLKYTLIARRSSLFAGTRYLRRGANSAGDVANEVESEQIITLENTHFDAQKSTKRKQQEDGTGDHVEDHKPYYRSTSLVQVRGSIPMYWSHTNMLAPSPDIQLEKCPLKIRSGYAVVESSADDTGLCDNDLTDAMNTSTNSTVMGRSVGASSISLLESTSNSVVDADADSSKSQTFSSYKNTAEEDSNLHQYKVALKHFQNLYERYNGTIYSLSLIRQSESKREEYLGTAFGAVCERLKDCDSSNWNSSPGNAANSDNNALKQTKASTSQQQQPLLQYNTFDMLACTRLAAQQQALTVGGDARSIDSHSVVFDHLSEMEHEVFPYSGFFVQADPAGGGRGDVDTDESTSSSSSTSATLDSPAESSEGQETEDTVVISHTDSIHSSRVLPRQAHSRYEFWDYERANAFLNEAHKPLPVSTSTTTSSPFIGIGTSTGVLQRGILRTNCIDCLDRTNIAQFNYAKNAIDFQLLALGLQVSKPSLDHLHILAMECWSAHGDVMANQYGGSGAMHKLKQSSHACREMVHTLSTASAEGVNPATTHATDSLNGRGTQSVLIAASDNSLSEKVLAAMSTAAVTNTAKASHTQQQQHKPKVFSLSSGAQNALVAVQRYYSNIRTDFERQQGIDLLLGVYVPYKYKDSLIPSAQRTVVQASVSAVKPVAPLTPVAITNDGRTDAPNNVSSAASAPLNPVPIVVASSVRTKQQLWDVEQNPSRMRVSYRDLTSESAYLQALQEKRYLACQPLQQQQQPQSQSQTAGGDEYTVVDKPTTAAWCVVSDGTGRDNNGDNDNDNNSDTCGTPKPEQQQQPQQQTQQQSQQSQQQDKSNTHQQHVGSIDLIGPPETRLYDFSEVTGEKIEYTAFPYTERVSNHAANYRPQNTVAENRIKSSTQSQTQARSTNTSSPTDGEGSARTSLSDSFVNVLSQWIVQPTTVLASTTPTVVGAETDFPADVRSSEVHSDFSGKQLLTTLEADTTSGAAVYYGKVLTGVAIPEPLPHGSLKPAVLPTEPECGTITDTSVGMEAVADVKDQCVQGENDKEKDDKCVIS